MINIYNNIVYFTVILIIMYIFMWTMLVVYFRFFFWKLTTTHRIFFLLFCCHNFLLLAVYSLCCSFLSPFIFLYCLVGLKLFLKRCKGLKKVLFYYILSTKFFFETSFFAFLTEHIICICIHIVYPILLAILNRTF